MFSAEVNCSIEVLCFAHKRCRHFTAKQKRFVPKNCDRGLENVAAEGRVSKSEVTVFFEVSFIIVDFFLMHIAHALP